MTNLRPGGYDERYHGGAIALGGGEIFDELFDLEDLNLLVGFFFGGWHGRKIISIDIAVGGSSTINGMKGYSPPSMAMRNAYRSTILMN